MKISLFSLPFLAACSDPAKVGTVGAPDATVTQSDAGVGANDGSTSITDAAIVDAAPEASALDPLELNDAGCLSWGAAEKFCGFKSDEKVCEFSVGCATSETKSQCQINCEMWTTTTCLTQKDAQCLHDAVTTNSCEKLEKCEWKL